MRDALGGGRREPAASQMRPDDAVAVARGLFGRERSLEGGDVLRGAGAHRAALWWPSSTTCAASDAAMLAISCASAGGAAGTQPISRSDAAVSAAASAARTLRHPAGSAAGGGLWRGLEVSYPGRGTRRDSTCACSDSCPPCICLDN